MKQELDAVLRAHRTWVESGKRDGHRAQLAGINLSGMDLSGVNLEEANLQAANLTGANLQRANLRWANLQEATLRHADLTEAQLQSADLGGADLRGATFHASDLIRANLWQAFFDEGTSEVVRLREARKEEQLALESQFRERHQADLRISQAREARLAELRRSYSGASPFIAVTKGIVGGISPPTVRSQSVIVKNLSSDAFDVWHGESRVGKGLIDADAFRALFARLSELGLWDLPLENPLGVEDIYGLDTSIHAHQNFRCWTNRAPSACVRGVSSIQPTPSDVSAFKEVVDLVDRQVALLVRSEEAMEAETVSTILSLLVSDPRTPCA